MACFKVAGKIPTASDLFTMLTMIGFSRPEHSFKSQTGIGSEKLCLGLMFKIIVLRESKVI